MNTSNYASFWQRFGAALIDGILFGVVSNVLGAILPSLSEARSWITPLVFWIYAVYMTVNYGATLGKMALKIRVQNESTGANLTYGEAVLREVVGKFLSSLIFLLGYLWMLWDPKKQTWHDKLGKSIVVKAAK